MTLHAGTEKISLAKGFMIINELSLSGFILIPKDKNQGLSRTTL